jgi:hypothetical protein
MKYVPSALRGCSMLHTVEGAGTHVGCVSLAAIPSLSQQAADTLRQEEEGAVRGAETMLFLSVPDCHLPSLSLHAHTQEEGVL